MFPSQMVRLKIVRLKIVETSSGPLCPCFPRKWYALKLSNPQAVHFVPCFASQIVRLKIVEPSSGPLYPCFPRKWYALKLSNPQAVHFIYVSLANGTP